jgi:hypothetical protein
LEKREEEVCQVRLQQARVKKSPKSQACGHHHKRESQRNQICISIRTQKSIRKSIHGKNCCDQASNDVLNSDMSKVKIVISRIAKSEKNKK